MSNLSKTVKYVNANDESIVFDYPYGFLISKPIGIDMLSVDHTESLGINQVGSTIQGSTIRSRAINISGIIFGNAISGHKEKLLSVVRPDLKGRLYLDNWFVDVVPTITPSISAGESKARFNFALLAAYPYWQNDEKTATVLSGLEYAFKLPANFSRPYRFGRWVKTSFFNIENRGQVPVPFRVTMQALNECVNPIITNVKTGEFLSINKSLVVGERIVVDVTHSNTTVMSSVDGDIRGALSLSSRLFRLNVGENVWKTDAESGIDGLEIKVEYSTERAGMAL